jgi:hypothetical protein
MISACESTYDKCLRFYIDDEGYSYDETSEQCDEEQWAYRDAMARE